MCGIIDDESYFTLSNSTSSDNQLFYSDDDFQTPAMHKNRATAKFDMLLWEGFVWTRIVYDIYAFSRYIYGEKDL